MMSTNGANVFMTEDGIHVHHPTLTREQVQENISKILNWVNGPGKKLLISQTRLPYSFEEADEIRKAHEQFEFKCMQALAMYAQLREPKDLDYTTSDNLDRMEQVVKGFMQSLQKRRNVVVACYTFFRLVSELRELAQSPDQFAEMLEAANDVESVGRCLSRLSNTLRSLETKSAQLVREGERVRSLVEQLMMIQAVERAVEESRRRVASTSEDLKLRILETKKRQQVLTCERDAQQANDWLGEMGDRLVGTYRTDCVGMTPVESSARLDAHKQLETKASETHEYCKQLAQALGLMYRAAGQPLDRVDVFTRDTAALWRRLTRLMQETRERLEVADAFYRNVDILLSRVEQLLILISRDLDSGVPIKQVRTKYGRGRDELLGEFEDTKNVGVALIERIQLGLDDENNEGAESIERTNNVIKMKLYTLWLKIREFLMLLGQKMEITAWIERWAVVEIQIERIYEMMLQYEQRWEMRERWPRTVPDAEEAVAEHRRAGSDVNRLFDQVVRDLEPLIGRAEGDKGSAEDEAVRAAATQAVSELRDRKGDWDQRWEAHRDRLGKRLELLMLMNDLEKEVDMRLELLEQCKKRPLDEERPVRESHTQMGHWLEDIPRYPLKPDLRRRINEFFGRLKAEVGDDFQEDESRLKKKWGLYENEMDLFRWLVDVALEILDYYERTGVSLQNFVDRLPRAESIPEIDDMLQELVALIDEGQRLVQPEELKRVSRELYSSEEPVQPLLARLDSVTVEINQLVDEANAMKENCDEGVIQVAKVRGVHSERPMLTMEANEPRAGEEFELTVNYSGLGTAPNVSWFRNGRPWSVRPPWRETWDDGLMRLRKAGCSPDDSGLYTCVLEHGGARAEGSFDLKVMEPPRFVRHLDPNPRFVEGDPVLLQCQVSGEPEPMCQWFHEGRPVLPGRDDLVVDNGDGVCAIKIPHIQPRHAGRYECRISNAAGEAVERTQVDVQDDDPADSESVASRVTLDSGAEDPKSVPDLANAFSNGQEEPTEAYESPFLRGRAAAAKTARPYRPSDDLPDDQKRSWTFHRDYYQQVPPRKPETTVRPSLKESLPPNQDFSENDPMELTVRYDGTPPPDVSWFKDGRVLLGRPGLKITTSPNKSTLTIDRAAPSDGGLYSAVIQNPLGSQRCNSQVSIRPAGFAPTLIRQSSLEQTVREGEPVSFEFIVSAEPPVEVVWFKGNRAIQPTREFAFESPEPGVHRLNIAKAYLEDSGRYRAAATNALGSKEVPFELLVDPYSDDAPTPCPPRLTEPLDEEQVCSAGDRVFLRSRIAGHPPPLVTWYKDGKQLDSSDDHQPDKQPRIEISNFDDEYRLVIPDAKSTDTGVYKLLATNNMGNTFSECKIEIVGSESDHMRTTLIFHNTVIKSPPEFASLFRDEICKVGDTVVLECQIVGLPQPTVWWSFNGEMIDETRCQFNNNGEKYSLVIPSVRVEDSGRYSVTAENSSGVATCSSLVIVEEHGKTGLLDRGNFSRSSSRPMSPLLAMPLPNHSQLSHLAPAAAQERARTVEVSPSRKLGFDFDNPPKLIVDRFENVGTVPPGGIITASQATRQHAPSPSILKHSPQSSPKKESPSRSGVQIVRQMDISDGSSSQTASIGRRPFGKPAGGGANVKIVREFDSSASGSFPRNPKVTISAGPAVKDEKQRFSLVESSEYDSN